MEEHLHSDWVGNIGNVVWYSFIGGWIYTLKMKLGLLTFLCSCKILAEILPLGLKISCFGELLPTICVIRRMLKRATNNLRLTGSCTASLHLVSIIKGMMTRFKPRTCFYLWSIITLGVFCNVPYVLASFLRGKAVNSRVVSPITGGRFVTCIARSYNILVSGMIRYLVHIPHNDLTTNFLETMRVIVNLGVLLGYQRMIWKCRLSTRRSKDWEEEDNKENEHNHNRPTHQWVAARRVMTWWRVI